MATPADKIEKRLAELKKEIPKRGLERHPVVLKNITDLPLELQSPATTTISTGETLQTIIAFPAQIHHGWHYVPKQALLFIPSGVIHIMASIWPDHEPRVTRVNSRELFYIKITLMLLYGSLEIIALGDDLPTHLHMEFNTVAWAYLSVPLRQLLGATNPSNGAPVDEYNFSPTVQQAVQELPLKFFNGLYIYGILPGEKLEALVFQPGTWSVWKRWLLFFRKPIIANTLLLITSNFIVGIQEELGVEYGWIITYTPRGNIERMQNQLRGNWNELTVLLKQGKQTAECKFLLKGEVTEAWRKLWIQHIGQWHELPEEGEK
jgi:hypothetical protein